MVKKILKIIAEGAYYGLVGSVALATMVAAFALVHILLWFISYLVG
jgi:hypothetical protein